MDLLSFADIETEHFNLRLNSMQVLYPNPNPHVVNRAKTQCCELAQIMLQLWHFGPDDLFGSEYEMAGFKIGMKCAQL